MIFVVNMTAKQAQKELIAQHKRVNLHAGFYASIIISQSILISDMWHSTILLAFIFVSHSTGQTHTKITIISLQLMKKVMKIKCEHTTKILHNLQISHLYLEKRPSQSIYKQKRERDRHLQFKTRRRKVNEKRPKLHAEQSDLDRIRTTAQQENVL